MSLRDDERGQAIQVGAVLLFAILIVAFSTYQAVIIPADNRRVEFNHNQEVQEQLTDLRNAVLSATGADGARSVTVALGTQYPSRTLGLNPNSPSGSLRTVGTTDPAVGLTIENATASGETGDLWDGTALSYNTGTVRYSPIYNRYDEAPRTFYDTSVLYNRFGAGNSIVLANQTVVDGDRLSIVTVNGSLDRSAATATSVDVRPVSASSETILVEAAGSNAPLTLTFTSTLSAGEWERILSDEQNVVDVSGSASPAGSDFTDIRVELATGVEYQLGMTKAAVGQGATAEEQAYLTDESGDGASVQRGASQQLTLAVRDRYNNPVAGVTLNGTVDGANSGSLDSSTKTTGTDGDVTFTYSTTTSTNTGDQPVNFTINDASALSGSSFDAETTDNVSMTVSVAASGGGGGGGAYAVEWTDPSDEDTNSGDEFGSCDEESCTWDVGASPDGSLDLNATVSPDFEGVDLEFAVSNSTVGTVSPENAATGSNGAAITTLDANANGTVNVLASGNDGSDVITMEVVNVSGGGGGQDSSSQMALISGSSGTFWGGGGVTFQVQNSGSTPVTISGVTVNSTTAGQVARIAEANGGTAGRGQHEVYVGASTDGILDMDGQPYSDDDGTPLQIGSREPMTQVGTVDAGTTTTIDIFEFRNNGGNAVSMGGETVTVTLHYSDGSAESYNVQP